jgi:hypothetical protein
VTDVQAKMIEGKLAALLDGAREARGLLGEFLTQYLTPRSCYVAHRRVVDGPPPDGPGWRPVGGYYVPGATVDAKGKPILPPPAGEAWTVWSRVIR